MTVTVRWKGEHPIRVFGGLEVKPGEAVVVNSEAVDALPLAKQWEVVDDRADDEPEGE